MRILVTLALATLIGCGPSGRDTSDSGDDTPPPSPDACSGLECQVVNCAAKGMPDTTISGTVFAPNGTLALSGVTVYVPLLDPPPFEQGVQCARCQSSLPGAAVAATTSGIDGTFTLSKVPSGSAVPLIVTIGKWRRKVVLPSVTECTDNPLPANLTSLPKNKSEGELPKIAMVSGGCDRLECLLRKLGVSDSEFTHDAGNGSIHIYDGGGFTQAHAQTLQTESVLTSDLTKLKNYDIAMWSCDCSRTSQSRTQAMMDNVKAYADAGGRLFFSHYNSLWIGGNGTITPQVWPTVAQCNVDASVPNPGTGVIDQTAHAKGPTFASWMQAVGASTTAGQLTITDTRQTCSTIDPTKGAERWVHLIGGQLQNFQFYAPAEGPAEERCGKVVMSDMHVSGNGTSGSFPGTACGAVGASLSPQEKALAFMFFDIASCVGDIL